MQKAVQCVKQKHMSLRQAAKFYKVTKSTLADKVNKNHEKPVGRPTVLTPAEEKSIVQHTITLSDYWVSFYYI